MNEQIEGIFSKDIFGWAIRQLAPGESINDKRYKDFISVTSTEIETYVEEHGFTGRKVKEIHMGDPSIAEDQICIEESTHGWEVYYIERGRKSQEAFFMTLAEARREVIGRLIRTAKIMLNARYRHAHPELNLPPPNEMD